MDPGGTPGSSAGDDDGLDLDLELVELDPPSVGIDVSRLRALVPFVLAAEGKRGAWSITVVLTEDRRLRALHRDFMALDEVTDVMTFPHGEEHGPQGAEVVVSVERAAEQGPEHGLTAREEVEFLLVHGLLHLCGWDDRDQDARDRMHARQEELLAQFERARAASA